MNDARKQVLQTARAVTEQAKTSKRVEGVVRRVAKLAGSISNVSVEQSKIANSLTGEADGVRRFARQSSRAVAEQATALTALAASAARQTSALGNVASAASEQSAALTRLGELTGHLKARTKEISGALDLQIKSAGAAAEDVRIMSAEIAQIRALTGEQAALTETLVEDLSRQESVRHRHLDEKGEAS
jgi:hypothetical protein